MSEEQGNEIERRFRRNMMIVIGVALIIGFYWAGWRMGLGILLGGVLCIFNLRWLGGSVRAILSREVMIENLPVPRLAAAKLILRYFVIAGVVGAAIWAGIFHPIGIVFGFASFIGGVMIEAGYQLYLYLTTRQTSENE